MLCIRCGIEPKRTETKVRVLEGGIATAIAYHCPRCHFGCASIYGQEDAEAHWQRLQKTRPLQEEWKL